MDECLEVYLLPGALSSAYAGKLNGHLNSAVSPAVLPLVSTDLAEHSGSQNRKPRGLQGGREF